ncbi:MAG TPA: tetratricopeptide repeat protein [Methylomirabilota bacterium]|nr:tetratricopeptide repeat protein [Methylomirabilota bacterium]
MMTTPTSRPASMPAPSPRRGLKAAFAAVLLAASAVSQAAAEAAPAADSLSGNYLAARFANNQADMIESARFFAEALADDPEDPFLLERTLALSLAAGDIEEGIEVARRLVDVDDGNRLAALSLGIGSIRAKDWTKAVETLKRANSGPLAGLTVEVLSAWSEAGAGNIDKALARLDALKGEEWYAFFRAYHGGLIASVAGRDDDANRRLRQAYELDDGAVRVIEALIRSLARSGKPDEARQVLNDAMERVPNHPLLIAVENEIAGDRKPKPLVSTVHQGAAEILAGLGAAIARDDTGELAAVYLQFALSLDPRADLARITLAEIFERSKQFEKSIELLAGVPDNSPLKRNAEIQVGFDYNSLDKVDDARAHLGALVEEDPSDLEAVMALGNVLRVRKMFDEAAETYTRGIDTLDDPQPQHWTLYYNRGIAYERTDRWPLAEGDFKTALKLRPDQPLVLNYLGYSWVDKGMNYVEALDMIEKAVELEPTDGYIIDSLGWVYYKLGRYEEAVQQLERAVSLKANDPTINDHLGDAYWRVGRKLEARFQWSHARDLEPEPEDLEKILGKLTNGMTDPNAPAAADASGVPPATPPAQP